MRKVLGVVCLMVLVLPAVLFAAPAGSQKVTLTLWNEYASSKAFWDSLLAKFSQLNPGITVDMRALGNDEYFTALRTGLAANEVPDLIQNEAYFQSAEFAKEGYLMDITDWAKQKGNLWMKGGLEASRWNGKYWGIPMTMVAEGQVYYNVDIMKKYNISIPPATWADFLADCQKLKDNGITPIAYGAKDGWPGKQWFEIFLTQLEGSTAVWRTIAGKPGYTWNSSMGVKAAEYYQSLYTKGYFQDGCAGINYDVAKSYFFAGKAAMFQTGSWLMSDTSVPAGFNWNIFRFPKLPEGLGDIHQIPAMWIDTQSVWSKTKYKDAALKFLDFIGSVETGKMFAKQGNFSAVLGAMTPDVANPMQVQVGKWLAEATGTVAGLELCVDPTVGEDKMYNGSVSVVNGDMTAKQWVDEIQAAQDKAVAAGKVVDFGY